MSIRGSVLICLLVLLICLTVASNVQAQTTTITNLQYPEQAVLQNGVAQASVTFTVDFSDIPSGSYLNFMIVYAGSAYRPASATSTPDPCAPFSGLRVTYDAICRTTPTSSSGTESVSFVLAFNSAQQYRLVAAALMMDTSGHEIGGSVATPKAFMISVTYAH
jgi:hypothetical protein